jgi:hypothetical protein
MKTLNGSAFIAAPRPGKERERGPLARIIGWLARGSVPVDGCNAPDEKPARERRPEPVRWGNFR